MLVSHVEDLTSSMNSNAKIFTELTSTELRIASLIKNGLTSEEIAAHLYISPSTVKTHRKNIRRKLNLSNTHQNLRIYLQSKLDDGRPARATA
jgi:DNA-binding NarL/FixJ family response regulator